MRLKTTIVLATICVSMLTGFGFAKKTDSQKRKEILEMRTEVLAQLYEDAPHARDVIAEAAGYAVFTSFGANVLVVSTANGKGVLHDNATGKDTYMRMFSAGGGIGMGIKDYRLVFVFDDAEAMEWFAEEGWQANAQADAAAKHGEDGDALGLAFDVAPGVYLYQMTESGLAAQATIQGTKYWKDDDLN